MEPSGHKPGFFPRLKQHHIYRVVVVYAIACWVLIQLANSLFADFGISRQAVRILIIVLLLGFPLVLVLSWMLIKPKDPVQYTAWQRLHWKLGAGLSVAVAIVVVVSGFYAWRFSAKLDTVQTVSRQATPAFNPPSDSLVVLPFTNLNGDPEQRYFSDGITQELTEALGKNPALRVIAWDTAATFRDPKHTAVDIGKQLNVSNLLYGSILRQGERVRISVELVNTVTGYLLWSAHYDESFKNIFVVQDEVSKAIAGTLQVKFEQSDLPAFGTQRPEAHELVLKGRALLDKADSASLMAAREDFKQAIALDANYADAYALLARLLIVLTERSDLPLKASLPAIRTAAEKALAIDPHNADAWVALGTADDSAAPPNITKARIDFQQALTLDPSNAAAHADYGTILPLKENFAQEQEATLLDPSNAAAWNNLAVSAQDLGNWRQEIQAVEALLKLDPQDVDGAFALAFAHQQLRQYDKMLAAFDLVKPATPVDREQIAAGRLTYQAVQDAKLRPQALAALKALAHHQTNLDVASNLLQLYLALGDTTPALKLLTSLCPADPAACSDLAISPIYEPLRGDSHFKRLAAKYTTVTVQ